MRRLLTLASLFGVTASGLAACADSTTNPQLAHVNVRLRNDAGQSAGRNLVVITRLSDSTKTQASIDGNGDIVLASGGAYEIRVIPRAGLYASAIQSRTVSASSGQRSFVEFTLYRAAWAPGDGPFFDGCCN
jgi:hypothetical protein